MLCGTARIASCALMMMIGSISKTSVKPGADQGAAIGRKAVQANQARHQSVIDLAADFRARVHIETIIAAPRFQVVFLVGARRRDVDGQVQRRGQGPRHIDQV